jgi:hypothetical protein
MASVASGFSIIASVAVAESRMPFSVGAAVELHAASKNTDNTKNTLSL